MNILRIIDRLKAEEGFSPVAFWDRKQWTFGWGCKAPHEGATITEAEATALLETRVEEAIKGYNTLFHDCPTPISELRQECLVDMIFNLGVDGVRHFRQMVDDIMDKDPDDWNEIADHAMDSLWYGQVKSRAVRIVSELRTGKPMEVIA